MDMLAVMPRSAVQTFTQHRKLKLKQTIKKQKHYEKINTFFPLQFYTYLFLQWSSIMCTKFSAE